MSADGQGGRLPFASRASKPTSLRTRLLRHLTPALLLAWVLGSLVGLYTAAYFTKLAYDRSMLDDAQLLAAHVKLRDGKLKLEVSDEDMQSILYDATETNYYAVLAADGRLVAGTRGLILPEELDGNEIQYADMRHGRIRLHGVVLSRQLPLPYRVVVAGTSGSRDTLLNHLFVASIAPQALLLLGLALWLRRLIHAELQPLTELAQTIESRDSADLTPLPRVQNGGAPSSDVQALSNAIDGLLQRVAWSLSAQREFAGNVAHELRTPLAGVRAAAEFGLAQEDCSQWREQLVAVLRSEKRASHLVEQLLALALAKEADSALSLKPLKLNDCVRELMLGWLPRADALGVELVAAGLDEDVFVRADRALVEGLLGNLLDNAFRYGRAPAGGHDSISVVVSRVAGEIWLSVIDQGPGIPAEQRQRLRDRWKQGDAGAELGAGSGLGLAICERFAGLMHARLVLDTGFAGHGLRASVVFEGLAADFASP
ncbi:sensor histidine kinase [Pelomonas sp. SE-A7]|uniref:sensor histidine kinase n=1 Tax=Pelomonas sp. SE-A7 TaxID=3054953 RepID=UPI00259C7698|nr:sensor histidine kinase [Pelomonas sp. SE-A7]MDM4765175.1 sensor histidine kinase [Pelomonas sp. SE-A7]